MAKIVIVTSKAMEKEVRRIVHDYRVFYASVSDFGKTAIQNEILRVRTAEAKEAKN